VIASAVRTPIGRFGGAFRDLAATELGAIAVREAVAHAGIDGSRIADVIIGNVIGAGLGQNPARQAAIGAGLPTTAPAATVNMVCGSGLRAVIMAAQAIGAGQAEAIVAGGMESMTQAPYLIEKARFGYKMGDGALTDAMIRDGLCDAYDGRHMGLYAEALAGKLGIDRKEQDDFALESHEKAAKAQDAGAFADEIVPVQTRQGIVDTDECPRHDTSAEALAALKPAFQKDGTITAGNASQISDGASALVVMSGEQAAELEVRPLARIVDWAIAGVEPRDFATAPIFAVRKVLERTGLELRDIGLIEANEAFAIQALAVGRELGFDWARVNINGGAVALGHPIGCTGARILTTLVHSMCRLDLHMGLATLCVGGGHGVAMIVAR
jgi:acetyl-CoA C-acetyltransferase